jgi:Protein of unknown function (DUF2569)
LELSVIVESLTGFFFIAIAVLIVHSFKSRNNSTAIDTVIGKEPVGIGGWLILPIIGFVVTIILTGKNLKDAFSTENFEGIKFAFTDQSGTLTTLQIPFAGSIIMGVFVMLSASICLILIFVKSRKVVAVATIHYVILSAAGLFDFYAFSVIRTVLPDVPDDPAIAQDAVKGVVLALIWIFYFHHSRRVQNTFVK